MLTATIRWSRSAVQQQRVAMLSLSERKATQRHHLALKYTDFSSMISMGVQEFMEVLCPASPSYA